MSNMESDMIIINVIAKKSSNTIELSVPDDIFNQAERILLKNERGVFCKTFPAEAFGSDAWIGVKKIYPKQIQRLVKASLFLLMTQKWGRR